MPHCNHSGFCDAEVAQQFLILAEKVVSSLPIGETQLRTLALDALQAFEDADHDDAPASNGPTLAAVDAKLYDLVRGLAWLYR